MKKEAIMKAFIALLLLVGLFYPFVSLSNAEAVSLEERGMTLFTDPGLGGSPTDKSCASCHRGGKGLEKVARTTWAPGELEALINGCVTRVLRGKELGSDSDEMKAIVAYIKSLGNTSSEEKK